MMRGSPPTELKARTGLLTPPTRSFVARSKISRERRRWSRCRVGRVAFIARSKKDEEKNLTQRAQRAQRTQGGSPDRVTPRHFVWICNRMKTRSMLIDAAGGAICRLLKTQAS